MIDVAPGHRFPAMRDPNGLPRRVLVLVAHPDDEVIGIGGLLAFHGERGDHVRVVHATRGDAGDPEGRHEGIAELRARELEQALRELGIGPSEQMGLPDGRLADERPALEERVRALFAEERPELLYTFHAGEFHADHREIARAACLARDELPEGCQVALFGVNQLVAFGTLYEYSARVAQKQRALACFETQLAYLDFAAKVMHRDQAATVNVEIPEITHAEIVLEIDAAAWPRHWDSCERARMDAEGSGGEEGA